MVDIDKLEEQRRELDRKIRSARRAEAAKRAEEEAKHYTALGKAVAEKFGGDAEGVQERSDAAREQLGLPAAPETKRRGRPKVEKKDEPQPQEQPAQQVRPEHAMPQHGGQEPAPHQFGG